MELTVRDWMVLVGVLLILAILLDGYRRMRNDRAGKIRVSLKKIPEDGSDPDHLLSAHELPAGGARVVNRAHDEAKNIDEDIPVLTDIVGDESSEMDVAPFDESELSGFSALSEDEARQGIAASTETAETNLASAQGIANKDVEDVIMLNVLAHQEVGFGGGDLLQILLACDLRFGEANFFHRHEQPSGRGPIQFSVASMVNPGVFDIDNMEGFSTPGVTFFLSLPGPEKPMQAFEYMLETAQVVANNLEGNILDEARSVMTKQTIEHCRQRIRDFERKMLTQTPS